MSYSPNTSQINDLSSLQARAGANISSAIKSASARTGVDFSYLMKQADVESSFKTGAKAKGSSATGLFQFIDSTWLSMVKKYGDKYGLSSLAAKISDTGKVASSAVRNQILSLRKDPQISALLAGEYASENKNYLESRTGGEVGSTELYMAHFMGADGAGDFLEAMNANPNAKGAALFKNAACSNPAIFYDASGAPRSLAQIYAQFDTKFSGDDASGTTAYAANTTTQTGAIKPDVYDENLGRWITSKPRSTTQLAQASSVNTAVAGNLGGIPGYRSLVANPVDIMSLLQYGQGDDTDKTANAWG